MNKNWFVVYKNGGNEMITSSQKREIKKAAHESIAEYGRDISRTHRIIVEKIVSFGYSVEFASDYGFSIALDMLN